MSDQRDSKIIDIANLKVACRNCNLFQLCLPLGLGDHDLDRLDAIIQRRRPIKRGTYLFQAHEPFRAVYALRSGSLKTFTLTDAGQEQINGFYLPGELLGLDAINIGSHPCSALALETSSVCEIPFERLEELSVEVPGLQHQLLRIMSRELFEERSLLAMLGKKSVEERMAAFLLDLSARYRARGFSATQFNLRMPRHDIANYLGMAVETVSRVIKRLQTEHVITAERKLVTIHDMPELQRIAGVETQNCSERATP